MEPAQSLALASSFSSLNSLTGYTNYGAMRNISGSSGRSLTLQPISLPTKRPRLKASMTDSFVATSTEGFRVLKDNLANLWINHLNCKENMHKGPKVFESETGARGGGSNSHVRVGWDSVKNSRQGTCRSPKRKLGSKWREYQGWNNWEGLLDPLDENLRQEIVKYGEFVQASYSAFEFDPQSKTYGCCKYSKRSLFDVVGLKNCGYRVTKNIHATSSLQFPQWLTHFLSSRLNSEGLTMAAKCISRPTSWIGFVAVCDEKEEIARLGRRDIVVAYRGTGTALEWAENVMTVMTPIEDFSGEQCSFTASSNHSALDCCQPKVESGFWSLYKCKDSAGRSASDKVVNELRRLVQLYKDEEISITITGHSLGSALALLTAYEVCEIFNKGNKGKCSKVQVTVFSFGGPRVGNSAFGRRLEEFGCRVLRVVNINDVITKVPGLVLNEWMHMMNQRSENVQRIVKILEKMPWAYCHVGTELRVNNKHSPYLKPDADMSCCHDLEAYLHLVDGFLSSSTPFRSTAKRDLVGLLVNQKSNVLLRASKINHDTERDTKSDKSLIRS